MSRESENSQKLALKKFMQDSNISMDKMLMLLGQMSFETQSKAEDDLPELDNHHLNISEVTTIFIKLGFSSENIISTVDIEGFAGAEISSSETLSQAVEAIVDRQIILFRVEAETRSFNIIEPNRNNHYVALYFRDDQPIYIDPTGKEVSTGIAEIINQYFPNFICSSIALQHTSESDIEGVYTMGSNDYDCGVFVAVIADILKSGTQDKIRLLEDESIELGQKVRQLLEEDADPKEVKSEINRVLEEARTKPRSNSKDSNRSSNPEAEATRKQKLLVDHEIAQDMNGEISVEFRINAQRTKTSVHGGGQGAHIYGFLSLAHTLVSTINAGNIDDVEMTLKAMCYAVLSAESRDRIDKISAMTSLDRDSRHEVLQSVKPEQQAQVRADLLYAKVDKKAKYVCNLVSIFIEEVQRDKGSVAYSRGRIRNDARAEGVTVKDSSRALFVLNRLYAISQIEDESRFQKAVAELKYSLTSLTKKLLEQGEDQEMHVARYGLSVWFGQGETALDKVDKFYDDLNKSPNPREVINAMIAELLQINAREQKVSKFIEGMFDYDRVVRFDCEEAFGLTGKVSKVDVWEQVVGYLNEDIKIDKIRLLKDSGLAIAEVSRTDITELCINIKKNMAFVENLCINLRRDSSGLDIYNQAITDFLQHGILENSRWEEAEFKGDNLTVETLLHQVYAKERDSQQR